MKRASHHLLCLFIAAMALALFIAPAAHAGESRGVRAEYFNWSGSPVFPATAAAVDRVENNISVYSSTASPAPGVGPDNYMVRYTGYLLIPTTGAYTFQVETDDGSRLYIDCDRDGSFSASELLIDKWFDQSYTAYTASCPSNLSGGQRYAFRYEFYDRGAEATSRLSWTGPSPLTSTMTVIPLGTSSQGLYSGVYESTPPTMVSSAIPCGANTLVYVSFSESLDLATAQTASNYTLPGGRTVTAASLLSDRLTMALTVSPALTANTTLTVNNVQDNSGNTIAANSSLNIPYQAASVAAGVLGYYFDQNATNGAYLTGNAAARIDSTINFDWASGTPGVTGIGVDDFSVRWTGLVLISASGSYVFRTRSDDGVRLYLNGAQVVNNWTNHAAAYDNTVALTLSAGSYVPMMIDYYESGGNAVIGLEWQTPSSSFVAVPAAQLFHCTSPTLASFAIAAASGTTSTCAPKDVTVTARDNSGNTLTTYTGTVTLTTSNARGDWTAGSLPAPAGVLNNGTTNDGAASYAFSAADNGVVKLRLAQTLAQNVIVTANDSTVIGTSTNSLAIAFRDNAFVFSEDASNQIVGSDIAVAGRPHDYTVTLIKKDPSTGSCGVATDFTGSRAMKMWRTDTSGSWTAPSVVSPVLTLPGSQSSANNITLNFASGIASFNLATTNIGRYALNLADTSLSYAALTISGTSNVLTVRPFAIVIQNIKQGSTLNTGGSLATDTVFTKAGVGFSATMGAYQWTAAMTSNGTDADNDGVPDAGATLANTVAGGLASGFNSTLTLSPLAGSQTPATGVLGTLNNGVNSSYSGGSATLNSLLQYTEVGSFALNTIGVVTNFISSGLNLNAFVFNSAGAQANRIGRFTPANFTLSNGSVLNRANASCSPASAFTYLSENFQLTFTLTAKNALGATTANYAGSFAKLDPNTAANWQLAGIGGTTPFKSSGTARLSVGTSSGSWSNGVATDVTLSAGALRATTPDGPFATAAFGIAPADSDGILMSSYDIDTDVPTNGNDHTSVATVPLRFGRLRLTNGMGSPNSPLGLPVAAHYWNGNAFADNTLDSCTVIPTAAVNFGNYRKTMTPADTAVSAGSLTLASGRATLTLAKPIAGHTGTFDLALSLGAAATDASCLQSWTPGTGDAATVGANLSYLRSAWCSSTYDKDPSARASFGLYRGSDNLIYQRENY